MWRLKELEVLGEYEMSHVKYLGTIKVTHVYNDYHLEKANPGFSCNCQANS